MRVCALVGERIRFDHANCLKDDGDVRIILVALGLFAIF